MQKAPAAGLGLEAALDAEAQPVRVGEIGAVPPVLASGEEVEQRGEKTCGERSVRRYGGHKNKNFMTV